MLEFLKNTDTQLFLFLNGINSPFWDTVMWQISGKLIWIPFYMLIIYFIAKQFGWKTLWILLAIAIVVTLADQLSVHLFKNVFERLRPCHNPEIKELVHNINRCGGRYGFVSSHAANSFGVAVFLVNLIRIKWFSIAVLFWAALVSYSRVYLGVHYPGDIIVGAMLGAGLGYGIWSLLVFIDKKSKGTILNSR
jgi:undecaprenyl-diphosphatase